LGDGENVGTDGQFLGVVGSFLVGLLGWAVRAYVSGLDEKVARLQQRQDTLVAAQAGFELEASNRLTALETKVSERE